MDPSVKVPDLLSFTQPAVSIHHPAAVTLRRLTDPPT